MNNNKDSANPFAEMAQTMKPELSLFRKYLIKQAAAFESEVRRAAKDALLPSGKHIRPMLVFCSAGDEADKNSLVRRASIAELVHISTLIHDDVIDDADLRRNCITPYKKYGAKTAILLGDAIFAHVMSLAFDENSMQVLKKTADCVRTICDGEIGQTLADKSEIVSRKKYFKVAYGKTAALFELACNLGATACEAEKGWVEAAGEIGRHLGIAYQIYDDICDWFMSEADAGKTLGTDLLNGKQTFPLIVLLEKLPSKISRNLAKELPSQSAERIAEMMSEYGVADECRAEFMRRVEASEKIASKFGCGKKLLKFCDAMKALKFGR